jgi:hypothetical protein
LAQEAILQRLRKTFTKKNEQGAIASARFFVLALAVSNESEAVIRNSFLLATPKGYFVVRP